jgi:hypothetical protein
MHVIDEQDQRAVLRLFAQYWRDCVEDDDEVETRPGDSGRKKVRQRPERDRLRPLRRGRPRHRPTFSARDRETLVCETRLPDTRGAVYDKTMSPRVAQRLFEERRFLVAPNERPLKR